VLPDATCPPGSVSYYFSDHLKTASVITDAAGNIKSESDYYPWGGDLQFVSNDSNHYKFTGKERDETGLDYFGARYYSNGLARFITPDWAAKATAVPYAEFTDPQSLNLYTYVRNIPTTKVDAEGHCPGDDCNRITVSVEVARPAEIIPEPRTGTTDSAKVEGYVRYRFQYDGKSLTNTTVHENINKFTVTINGATQSRTPTTGTANTKDTGSIVDKDNFVVAKPMKSTSPDSNAAVAGLSSAAVKHDTTQVLTFTSPTGCTCAVTEKRTISNIDASGHGSPTYVLTPTSPATQAATPVPGPKSTPSPKP
jgi:RHS repeat-associated protein